MSSIGIAVPTAQRAASRIARPAWLHLPRDRWMTATVLMATVLSVAAFAYAYQNHLILLYNDAYAHLVIARRVFDNTTPGLAQLGGVWLPLPHVIMLPFVWNDALWRSGLAGSFSSMPSYIIAACFIFLSARRMTHNSRASFIGALIFMLNPGMLYMQTTPLTEPVLIATMTAACYFFLAWVQDDESRWLIWAAACTFLATLARYDGWFLFVVFLCCIVVIDLQKRRTRKQLEDHLMLFGGLGGLGIALWFLWNWMIFHDALYFQNGPYSSQTQQMEVLHGGALTTYHNIWESFRHFLFASAETVGPVVLALGIIGLIVVLARKRLSPEAIGTLPFVAPFVFYVVALFTGQAVLFVPGAVPANASNIFYNARYGTEIVAPVAFFVAILIGRKVWVQFGFVAVILVQSVLIAHGGIIALQDGQYGASCAAARPTVNFLATHYATGKILEDSYYKNPQNFALSANIKLVDIVYQGSGITWANALSNPAAVVDWVAVHPGDIVSKNIDFTSATFLSQFTPVAQDSDGTVLYHRNAGTLANPTAPAAIDTAHALCGTNNG